MEKKISGRTIKCKTNINTSVVTISVVQMLYNKPAKINEMKFDFTDDCLKFTWKEQDEYNTIDVGMDGEYRMSEMHLKDLHYHAYSKAAWQSDGTLKLWIRPIETAHVRKFTFKFRDNGTVRVINKMSPTFQELAIYNFTFTGSPIKRKSTENFVKGIVEHVGLLYIEPDFTGKFAD